MPDENLVSSTYKQFEKVMVFAENSWYGAAGPFLSK